MFELFARYFWLLAIAGGFVNYFQMKKAAQPFIDEDPSREPGYEQFRNCFLAISLLPWLIVGAAVLSGEARTVFDFIHPQNPGWAVRIFWAILIGSWFAVSAWIIGGRGAEFIENHPGMLRFRVPGVDPERPTARQVRIFWIIAAVMSVVAFWLIFSQPDMPLPFAPELPPSPSR